jgi:MinD superfamily P-loop ATPase
MSFHEIESGEDLDVNTAMRIYFEAMRAQDEESRRVLMYEKRIRCHLCNEMTPLNIKEVSTENPPVMRVYCEACKKPLAQIKWRKP